MVTKLLQKVGLYTVSQSGQSSRFWQVTTSNNHQTGYVQRLKYNSLDKP